MNRSHKPDALQKEIVECLRKAGRCVFVAYKVGGGFPDLVVHWGGRVVFIEVKSESGKLTPAQIDFHQGWRGPPIVIVRSAKEALEATGIYVR